MVFVSFAPGRLWRAVSILFLAGTLLATIATGEHYTIDLIPGLVFGCFAANLGRRKIAQSAAYLSVVLAWSLTVRFAHNFLLDHAGLLQSFATATLIAAIAHVVAEWRAKPCPVPAAAGAVVPATVQS